MWISCASGHMGVSPNASNDEDVPALAAALCDQAGRNSVRINDQSRITENSFLAKLPLTIAQFETRSNMTLCARRFGVAVRRASTHERDCEDGTASASGVAHQSGRRRARSGSLKPRRVSICAKVRITVSAKRLSRYQYSDRYSHTDDGEEGAVVIASQEYWGGCLFSVRYCTPSTPSSGIVRRRAPYSNYPAFTVSTDEVLKKPQ
jgi:hypothetical protein